MRPAAAVLAAFLAFSPGACGGGDGVGPPEEEPEEPEEPTLTLAWPLAGTDAADADSVHSPYGPRWIGSYDFHAGVDLPAPVGRRVRAVQAGQVVQVRRWDGTSTGAGNAILIHHAGGRSTSYLHLAATQVFEGEWVAAGEVIGTVGATGASYPHLHLGYMLNLPGDAGDERRSRNPLELLPHTAPVEVPAIEFLNDHAVRLLLPLQAMTVRSVSLHGEGQARTLDYYAVVALGSVPRNATVQDGIGIDAGQASAGRFPLTLQPSPAEYRVERVVVVDIHGDTIADHHRPD